MEELIKRYEVKLVYQVGEEVFPSEQLAIDYQQEKILEEFLSDIEDPIFDEDKVNRDEMLDFLMDNYNDLRKLLISLGDRTESEKETLDFEALFKVF